MAEVFAQNQNKQHSSAPAVADGSNSPITVKFDGRNYGMWSQMVEVHLRSKNKLGHVSGSRTAPRQEDPEYKQWEIDDNTVKAWLLNSLDPSLLGNFLFFPTAKEVWDAIKTAFFDGSDGTRIYELQMRVRGCTQSGGSLEEYFNTLQRLWREIDLQKPNKNVCATDIANRNQEVQEERLYIFLGGLDRHLDNIRAEILRYQPLPTVEEAFAKVRREDVRQSIMTGRDEGVNPMAMIAQGNGVSNLNFVRNIPDAHEQFQGQFYGDKTGQMHSTWYSGPGISQGPAAHMIPHMPAAAKFGQYSGGMNLASGSNSMQKEGNEQPGGVAHFAAKQQGSSNQDKNNLKCTKCGNRRHTVDQCFEVIGYPDWWFELQKKKKKTATGKAKANLVVTGKTENDSDEGHSYEGDHWAWY
ncbi:uncharacterized protein LOC144560951 [Carex rostrata]